MNINKKILQIFPDADKQSWNVSSDLILQDYKEKIKKHDKCFGHPFHVVAIKGLSVFENKKNALTYSKFLTVIPCYKEGMTEILHLKSDILNASKLLADCFPENEISWIDIQPINGSTLTEAESNIGTFENIESLNINCFNSKQEVYISEGDREYTEGVVYFLMAEEIGLIKIGTSKNYNSRTEYGSEQIPTKGIMVAYKDGYYEEESELHKKFNSYRLNKKNKKGPQEWFILSDEIAKYIIENCTMLVEESEIMENIKHVK